MYGKIIVIKRTGTDGAHFPLTANTCLFGRGQDCDIRIQMPSVDNEQCVVNVDDKGHVFLKNLSAISPTLINEKAVSDSLTALSHGDIITIIDRKFRFEFPVESQFFPKSPRSKSPKSPRVKSPKTARMSNSESPIAKSPKSPNAKSPKSSGNLSIINETIVDLKSPAKLERKSPKPLTPRTDNVPVSEVYSKSPQKQSFTTSLKDVLAIDVSTSAKSQNSSSKYLMSPACFYNSTPKGLKRLSDVPHAKVTPVQRMTPGTSSQVISTPLSSEIATMPSPGRKSGSLYTRTNESLQKSINILKRRSMPLFERDEDNSLVESPATEVKSLVHSGKRKSSSFVMLSAKRKRVSFGPTLSPEHFDQTLPPKTPVKKGATPSRVNPGRKSLLKRHSPKNLTPKKTTPKSSPSTKVVAASEENISAAAVSVLETVISPSNQSSSKKQTGRRSSVDSPLSKQYSTEVMTPDALKSPKIPPRTRSLTPTSTKQEENSASLYKRRSNSVSPKRTVSNVSRTSVADSPMLSQDLFSQQSPLVTETSLTLDKSITSAKKKPVRAKSEGPAILSESLSPKDLAKKRVKSMGAIPPPSVGLTQKAKSVTLLGSSPLNVVHYKKTPVVRRGGKPVNKKHSFDVSLTGLKELVNTPKADLINASYTGIADLFNTSVEMNKTPVSSQLDISEGSLSTSSSGKRSQIPKRESLRGRSSITELTSLTQLFTTPTSHLVALAGRKSAGDTAGVSHPISTGKRNRTPKREFFQTPVGISANITDADVLMTSKTPGEKLDETDGYKATIDIAIAVDTPVPIESRRKGRPKKLSTSAQSDVSFSGMSVMFKSPENVTVTSSTPILSPKKAGTPKANTVLATPDKQADAIKSKTSTPKSADLNINMDMGKSVKRNRTPKKFFDEISPVSSKKKTPATEKSPLKNKSALMTPLSPKTSPHVANKSTEKIKSPPQDRNKVVALRVIHGHAITPKLPGLAKTPKLAGHTKTPSRTPKSIKKQVARNAVKTWSDIVKSGIPKPMAVNKTSLFSSNAAVAKKKPSIPLKQTLRTPKTPRALARALAPSTGHAESPATILIGKKLRLKPKTPKLLPRKGRKQPVSKVSRISTGNTSFSGLPEMFKTPEAGSSADLSALYDQIPDTPNGPNEMFVSPLSASKNKRKSASLTGVRELFAHKKRQSMKLVGVRELLKSPIPFSPGQRKSITPTGLKRLMKTPYVANTPKDLKHVLKTPKASPKITPSGLKRMMKVHTFASPDGVENLFQEIEEEVPKTSEKGRLHGLKETDASGRNIDNAEKSSNENVVTEASSLKKQNAGTKRKAVATDEQISPKKALRSPFVEKQVLAVVSTESGDEVSLKRGRKQQSAAKDTSEAPDNKTSTDVLSHGSNKVDFLSDENEYVDTTKTKEKSEEDFAKETAIQAGTTERQQLNIPKRGRFQATVIVHVDGDQGKSTEQADLSLKSTTASKCRGKPASETVQLEQNLSTISRRGRRAPAASGVEEIAPSVDDQKSAAAPVVKRGRGNATTKSVNTVTESNVTSIDSQPAAAPVVKRGRGHSTTKTGNTVTESIIINLDSQPAVAKRGRGNSTTTSGNTVTESMVTSIDSQPAAVPVVKRGRGKQATENGSDIVSKAIVEVVTSVDSQSAASPVVKRGRGKQATKKSAENITEAVVEIVPIIDSQTTAAPTVKRGRGRATTLSSHAVTESIVDDIVTSVDSQSAASPVVKRGRGKQATKKSAENITEAVVEIVPIIDSQTTAAPTVKRGRGKATTLSSHAVTESIVDDIVTSVDSQSAASPVVKRGRGKQATKKSAENITEAVVEIVPIIDSQSTAAPTVKRGRGKATTLSSHAVTESIVDDIVTSVDSQSAASPVVKRGRGKQATKKSAENITEAVVEIVPIIESQTTAAPTVKRGRGKPTTLSSHAVTESIVDDIVTSLDSQSAAAPAVKRGRGRQAALKSAEIVTESIEETVTTIDSQSTATAAVKRGRGRQAALNSAEIVTESIEETVTTIDSQSTATAAVKRGRGRQAALKSAEIVTDSIEEIATTVDIQSVTTAAVKRGRGKQVTNKSKEIVMKATSSLVESEQLLLSVAEQENAGDDIIEKTKKRGRTKTVLPEDITVETLKSNSSEVETLVSKRGKSKVSAEKVEVLEETVPPRAIVGDIQDLKIVVKRGKRTVGESLSSSSTIAVEPVIESSSRAGRSKAAKPAVSADNVTELKKGRKKIAEVATTLVDLPATTKSPVACRGEASVKLVRLDNKFSAGQPQTDSKKGRSKVVKSTTSTEDAAFEKGSVVVEKQSRTNRGKPLATFTENVSDIVKSEIKPAKRGRGRAGASSESNPLINTEDASVGKKKKIEEANVVPSPIGKRVKGRGVPTSAGISGVLPVRQISLGKKDVSGDQNDSKSSTEVKVLNGKRAAKVDIAVSLQTSEPAPLTGPTQKIRAKRTKDTENIIEIESAIPAKRSKTSSETVTSTIKQTKSIKITANKQVQEKKSKLDTVENSRSTRGRRK